MLKKTRFCYVLGAAAEVTLEVRVLEVQAAAVPVLFTLVRMEAEPLAAMEAHLIIRL